MSSESLLFKFDIFFDFIKKVTSLIELNRIMVLGIMKATKNLITKNKLNVASVQLESHELTSSNDINSTDNIIGRVNRNASNQMSIK